MRQFLPLLLLLGPPAAAQTPAPLPKAGQLRVYAELVGRAEDCPPPGGEELFFVRIEVRNLAAHALTFHQMSCSWTDSWTVEGPYHLTVLLCDKNVATPVTLKPRQALVYYGQLRSLRPATRPVRLRLAFVPGLISGELFAEQPDGQPILPYAAAHQLPVFWSQPFTTSFSNDSYRLSN